MLRMSLTERSACNKPKRRCRVKTSDILALSVDQKGIVMRKEDLRAATRKAAEKSVRRPGARLNPGEKLNRKHMATVATVYDIL
jgi:hypothetical protein